MFVAFPIAEHQHSMVAVKVATKPAEQETYLNLYASVPDESNPQLQVNCNVYFLFFMWL